MRQFYRIALFSFLFLVSLNVYAEPIKSGDEKLTLKERLIQDDIVITHFFSSLAEGLDLFLVGRQVTERPNPTHVKLENSIFFNDGKGITQTPDVLVDLRLPNLEDYWSLKFTSYDENEERRSVKQRYLGQTPRRRNYGATVGLMQKLGDIRVSFQPRIELRDPLQISHSLVFESVADMKSYRINPELELFATPSDGVGTYFALNFNIPFTPKHSLTFVNNGEYDEKPHIFSVLNGISWGHLLNRRQSLSYNFFVGSNNRDNYHLDSYTVSVGFTQEIFHNVFDYQLIPHWDFAKADSFIGRPGITLILTVTF